MALRKAKHDVVVIGGGPAGVCAAIAAARNGASTLLVEEQDYLGGVATGAMFQPWRGFHSFGKLLAVGMGEEIVKRLESSGGSPGHIVDPTGVSFTVTRFDVEILKKLLVAMCEENNVELALRAKAIGVEMSDGRIDSIQVLCPDGDVFYPVVVVIDASGNGAVAARSGARCLSHDPRCSFRFSMTNVGERELLEYVAKNPHEFSGPSPAKDGRILSVKGFTSMTKQWHDMSPQVAQTDSIQLDASNRAGELVVGMINFDRVDPEDPDAIERAELRRDQLVPRAVKFLVENCPGFSDSVLGTAPPRIGFHSSRQVCGGVTLSDSDVVSGRTFDDAVATCALPGSPMRTFQVSRRSLEVPQFSNFLVAGRCVLPPTALFATNNQPASMQLGEAAGKLAASMCGGTSAGKIETPASIKKKQLS